MPEEIDPPTPTRHPLIERYRESYRVATALAGLGTTVKALGWVVGALALVYGIAASLNVFGPLKYILAGGGLIAAALLVLAFHVLGTTVAAIGQTLRAAADTAVNTSPFLSNEQKAYALS